MRLQNTVQLFVVAPVEAYQGFCFQNTFTFLKSITCWERPKKPVFKIFVNLLHKVKYLNFSITNFKINENAY